MYREFRVYSSLPNSKPTKLALKAVPSEQLVKGVQGPRTWVLGRRWCRSAPRRARSSRQWVLRDECTTLRQPRVPNGVSGDGREPDATIVVIARPPPTAPHRTAWRSRGGGKDCRRITRNVGVLRYHHLQIVLMFGQLRASWSDLVRPRRSGHWKTTFPDTFEPERARAAQCEGLQLEHQSPPKWCVRRQPVTIIHLGAACAP